MGLKIHFYAKERFKDIILEPQPAEKMFPKWFSLLEKKSVSKCPFKFVNGPHDPWAIEPKNEDANLKGCPGIVDFLKQGYLIPSWDNFVFRDDGRGSLVVNWTDDSFGNKYGFHGPEQFSTMPQDSMPRYGYWSKIFSPWIVRTDPGVSCLITHPVWHRNNNFTTATSVMHTDKVPLNIPWFFEWNYKVKSGYDLETMDLKNQVVEKGTPLMLIIPFYRKKFQSSVEYVSDTTFDRYCHMKEYHTHSLKNNDLYSTFRKSLGKLFT